MHNPSKNNQPQANKGKTSRLRCLPWATQQYGRTEGKRERGGPGLFTSLCPLEASGALQLQQIIICTFFIKKTEVRRRGLPSLCCPSPCSPLDLWRERDFLSIKDSSSMRDLIFPNLHYDQGLSHELSMCPSQESKQRPFGAQAGALSGNQTGDFWAQRRTLNQLSCTSQGPSTKSQSPLLAWLLFDLQTCSIFSISILISPLFFFLCYQAVPFKSRCASSTLLKWFSWRSPVAFLRTTPLAFSVFLCFLILPASDTVDRVLPTEILLSQILSSGLLHFQLWGDHSAFSFLSFPTWT